MPEGFDLDAFLPQVGKNYVAPFIIEVPTGTVYQKFGFSRPVILQALTPSTVGTVYLYPGSTPGSDTVALPITNGIAFLDARGEWYIRTTSAGTERFRVLDGGGAGNAQAVMAALTGEPMDLVKIGGTAQTGLNLTARYVPVTWGTASIVTVNAADTAVAAANANRRALALFNASTGGQRIAVTTENPATAVRGFVILDQGMGFVFNPLDCPPTATLRGWASAAGGSLIVNEGT